MRVINLISLGLLCSLFLLIQTVSSSRGWFYSSDACTGDSISFDVKNYGECTSLRGGNARSLYSNSDNQEHWVAYRQAISCGTLSLADCGVEVCSFSALTSRCCVSSSINIKGAIVFSYRHLIINMPGPDQDPPAGDVEHPNNNGQNANDNRHPDEQTLPEDGITIRQPGVQAAVLLPDGSYHQLEHGVAQVTEHELQRQLQAKGLQPLPAYRIAELKVFGLVAK